MNYVIERPTYQGQDDPARVGDIDDWTAEEQRRYDREWNDCYATHLGRLLKEVEAVLGGGQATMQVEGKSFGKADLFEAMTESEEYDDIAMLLLGSKETGNKLIQKYCDQWAAHAANRDMETWQP